MTTPSAGLRQYPFDARPLTEPVDAHSVRAFTAAMRARGAGPSAAMTIVPLIIAVFIGVTIFSISVPLIAFAASAFSGGDPALTVLFAVLFIVVDAGVLAGIGLLIWSSARKGRIARYRLHQFAQANGMVYEESVTDPPLPGMIFNIGHGRKAERLVRGYSPRFVEFGNYQYSTGSGKSESTHHWGYVAVKLDVPLPNIVLDALGNNGFSTNLPAAFKKGQRLSLEGDFDKYFTLYCPQGYEQDALYLFTPDIMARFIDNAAELDVEIVEDWLFLYTKRQASTLDPATWAWLFGTVGALITKFDQWARWRDERMRHVTAAASISAGAGTHALPFAPPVGTLTPPPGVARQGLRLKRGVRWGALIFSFGFAVLWFAFIFGFGQLGGR